MTDQITTVTAQDLKDLAEFRKEDALLGKQILDLQTALDKTPEAMALKEAREKRTKLSDNISTIESFIRKSALDSFISTNVKPPFDAIKVKIFKVIKYDRKAAEKWAKETNPDAFFTFDQKGFEKYAKAVADTIPVPCVTFEDDPRVEIASDLSMYL